MTKPHRIVCLIATLFFVTCVCHQADDLVPIKSALWSGKQRRVVLVV